MDIRSLVLLLDDFRIIYNGGGYERRALPPIDVQYVDYCHWLKEWLQYVFYFFPDSDVALMFNQ